MYSYEIKIELLSDLCVSDGGVYNSALDLDICQDTYGFPVIPAKRLKGCLRESALELSEWGEKIDIDKLFGTEGQQTGIIRISDGYLSDSLEYSREINEVNSALYHRQNILLHYSYIRTQTSIDYDKGVADDTSLRNMRVVPKGYVFLADVESSEDCYEYLSKLCINLCNIGNSRTRGLGEVRLTLTSKSSAPVRVNASDSKKIGGATRLDYEIYLEEPVICKSLAGGQEKSQDFIEGSKILGIVAGRYRKKNQKEIVELLDLGKMCFSDAFISDEKERYTEVPGYVYAIKNHKETYINKLLDLDNKASVKDGETRQLNGMKHCYVSIDSEGKLKKKEVLLENRYHHRRPEDKSIGRAVSRDDNSAFYQISSISQGQAFSGFITGTPEQIEAVYELLNEDNSCRIGYGSSAEYGKCRITSLKMTASDRMEIKGKKLLVVLNSPAIIYSEKAMASTSAEDLKNEIVAALSGDVDNICPEILAKYINYTDIGGFNVTWNMRKPVVKAFDKGTAIVIGFKDEICVDTCSMFIGERNAEGFGECRISIFEESEIAEFPIVKMEEQRKSAKEINVNERPLAKMIATDIFNEFLKEQAVLLVAENKLGQKKKEVFKPTVSNMMLMCKENNTIEEVRVAVNERFEDKTSGKDDKFSAAKEILKVTEEFANDIVSKFEDAFVISGFRPIDNYELMCLERILQSIKYSLREKKEGEAE